MKKHICFYDLPSRPTEWLKNCWGLHFYILLHLTFSAVIKQFYLQKKSYRKLQKQMGMFIWGPHSLEKPSTLVILWMSFGVLNYLYAQPFYITLKWAKRSIKRSHFGTLGLLSMCVSNLKTAPSTQGLHTVIDNIIPERYACWCILVFEDNTFTYKQNTGQRTRIER